MPAAPGALNLAQIVSAAVSLADESGLEAVSMRRVADRLGTAAMSLYRHVADKDRLIALASDSVFGEEPFPAEPPSSWRTRLNESAWRQWRCYHRHPWIASVVSFGRPLLGPNGMREMEWAFEGLQPLPISERERLQVYLAVAAFVHGAADQLNAEAGAARESGLSQEDWWAAQASPLRSLFATGDYPLIARLSGSATLNADEWFEFGLGCLLDGLESRLESAIKGNGIS